MPPPAPKLTKTAYFTGQSNTIEAAITDATTKRDTFINTASNKVNKIVTETIQFVHFRAPVWNAVISLSYEEK